MSRFTLTFLLFAATLLGAYELARRLTGWSRRLAVRWGALNPVTPRSSHTVPTPRLGGVGLGLGYAVPTAAFFAALWFMPHEGAWIAFVPSRAGWVAAGWLVMFATGLIDDLRQLNPAAKLLLMTVGAAAPVLGADLTLRWTPPGLFPTDTAYALEAAAAILWILFFANGFNFMDGMDGFAAGFALYATLTWYGILIGGSVLSQSLLQLRAETYALPIVAMACWGFLRWNRPPARVFMGDGGSLPLGYLLAVYVILGREGALGLAMPAPVSAAILMPFVFDVVLTLVRRARRGERLWQAHREHLYQRLLRLGLTHAQVLRLNVRRFAACGAAAAAGAWLGGAWTWLGPAAALAVMIDYWQRVLTQERAAAEKAAAVARHG